MNNSFLHHVIMTAALLLLFGNVIMIHAHESPHDREIADAMGLTEGVVAEQLKTVCKDLADQGMCQTFSDIMTENCKDACIEWQKTLSDTKVETDNERDFYNLSAKTKDGKVMEFDRFEGHLTVVMNMGLTCVGDDEDKTNRQNKAIQNGLDAFDNILKVYPHGLEIVIFPFKAPAFGVKPEDDDCDMADIKAIVGVLTTKKAHLMEPIQMNGPDTHPVYKYLKKLFKKDTIETNLATYFFVNPDGNHIYKYYAASLDQIKRYLRDIFERDL